MFESPLTHVCDWVELAASVPRREPLNRSSRVDATDPVAVSVEAFAAVAEVV